MILYTHNINQAKIIIIIFWKQKNVQTLDMLALKIMMDYYAKLTYNIGLIANRFKWR